MGQAADGGVEEPDGVLRVGARYAIHREGCASGTREPEVQDDALANYASKLEKGEAVMDWSRSAVELDRQVRAFNPWPVAQTGYEGKVLRIWEARPLEGGADAAPGRVLAAGKEGIDVATGEGLLRIRTLQAPGKRAMSAADFLNAHNLEDALFG